jgi:hypothetical protein
MRGALQRPTRRTTSRLRTAELSSTTLDWSFWFTHSSYSQLWPGKLYESWLRTGASVVRDRGFFPRIGGKRPLVLPGGRQTGQLVTAFTQLGGDAATDAERPVLGANFSCDQAVWAESETHEHKLAGL